MVPLMMIAACDTTMPSGEDAASPAGGGVDSVSVAVALALLPPNQAGATAANSGVLAVRGRCLVLEAGGVRTNLAFATPQTEWDAAAGALRIGNLTLRPGTRVEVGGADFDGDLASLPWLRAPAPECRDRMWIVSSIGAA
jgi:hypothetical protein